MSWELDKILKRNVKQGTQTWDVYDIVAKKKLPKSSILGETLYKTQTVHPDTLKRLAKTPEQQAKRFIADLNTPKVIHGATSPNSFVTPTTSKKQNPSSVVW